MRRNLPCAATVTLLLASAGLPACAEDRIPYAYDTPVAEQLAEFRREGPHDATRRLDSMTTFGWDTVYLYGDGADYRAIDRAVGSELFGRNGRFNNNGGTLLVFTRAGQVVHAAALRAPVYLEGDRVAFPRATTVVRARTPDPGPYFLDLQARR